ncbi:MAG: RDD family protein [Alphaproteobacteria bacterium]|nr:RDD family protein [Alphaproteobacteria bacterium]
MSIISKRIWANIIDFMLFGAFFHFFYELLLQFKILHLDSDAISFLKGALFTGFFTLYFGILESSNWQASIGKKIMGLILCDAQGNRLGFWMCFTRALVFQFIWPITVIYALFTKKEEFLHDTAFDHTQVKMK